MRHYGAREKQPDSEPPRQKSLWVVCCLELLLIRKSAFPASVSGWQRLNPHRICWPVDTAAHWPHSGCLYYSITAMTQAGMRGSEAPASEPGPEDAGSSRSTETARRDPFMIMTVDVAHEANPGCLKCLSKPEHVNLKFTSESLVDSDALIVVLLRTLSRLLALALASGGLRAFLLVSRGRGVCHGQRPSVDVTVAVTVTVTLPLDRSAERGGQPHPGGRPAYSRGPSLSNKVCLPRGRGCSGSGTNPAPPPGHFRGARRVGY